MTDPRPATLHADTSLVGLGETEVDITVADVHIPSDDGSDDAALRVR